MVAGREPGPDATEEVVVEDRLRVLVVDDDQVDRMAFRRILARTGVRAEVSDAAGVLEAIDRLAASPFDCVFLDYNLPDGDGLTFLRGVRAAGISTPVVILTGETSEELSIELLVSGAADFISKEDLTAERLSASLAKVRGAR
jgi:CheY-like chemotaxis protein